MGTHPHESGSASQPFGFQPRPSRPLAPAPPSLNINLHRLEIFYQVARCRGIAEAVRCMPYGIQQPAVSEQIQLLEEELDAKLFERRPFRLTPEGRFLYEPLPPLMEELERRFERLCRRKKPRLRLAAEEGLEQSLLLPAIAPLQQIEPSAEIAVRTGPAGQLRQSLQDGELDLVIICSPPAGEGKPKTDGRTPAAGPCHRHRNQALNSGFSGGSGRVLATCPLALLVPASMKISTTDHFWTQKTITERLIAPDAAHAVSQAFDHGLKRGGLSWPARIDAGSIASVAPLVAARLGVGIIPNLPSLAQAAGVRVLPLAGFEPVVIACLWRPSEIRRLQAGASDYHSADPDDNALGAAPYSRTVSVSSGAPYPRQIFPDRIRHGN